NDGDGTDTPVGSMYGWGMLYDSGTNQTKVFLRGANNTSSFVAVTGLPMLDITVTKTNGGLPAARGDDPIVLEVFKGGVLQGTVSSTLGSGIFSDTSEYVEFGNLNGAPSGTFALRWATFGIGEPAPLPEPAA